MVGVHWKYSMRKRSEDEISSLLVLSNRMTSTSHRHWYTTIVVRKTLQPTHTNKHIDIKPVENLKRLVTSYCVGDYMCNYTAKKLTSGIPSADRKQTIADSLINYRSLSGMRAKTGNKQFPFPPTKRLNTQQKSTHPPWCFRLLITLTVLHEQIETTPLHSVS